MYLWKESDPWVKSGILRSGVHGRLIAMRHSIGNRSGLGKTDEDVKVLWEKFSDDVTDGEREYLKRILRKQPTRRLMIYTGDELKANQRIRQVIGAAIRNFLDARIIETGRLVGFSIDEYQSTPDILAIPDYGCVDFVKDLSDRQNALLEQYLANRICTQKPLILYTPKISDITSSRLRKLMREVKTHTVDV